MLPQHLILDSWHRLEVFDKRRVPEAKWQNRELVRHSPGRTGMRASQGRETPVQRAGQGAGWANVGARSLLEKLRLLAHIRKLLAQMVDVALDPLLLVLGQRQRRDALAADLVLAAARVDQQPRNLGVSARSGPAAQGRSERSVNRVPGSGARRRRPGRRLGWQRTAVPSS